MRRNAKAGGSLPKKIILPDGMSSLGIRKLRSQQPPDITCFGARRISEEGKTFPGISEKLWEEIRQVPRATRNPDDKLSPATQKALCRLKSVEDQLEALLMEIEYREDHYLLARLAHGVAGVIRTINRCQPAALEFAMERVNAFPVAIPSDSAHAKEWERTRKKLMEAQKRHEEKAGPFCPPLPPLKGATRSLTLGMLKVAIVQMMRGKMDLPPWRMCPQTLPFYEKAVFEILANRPDYLERHFGLLSVEMRKETYTKGQKVDWLKKAVREDFRTLKRIAERAINGNRFSGKKPVG